MEPTKKQMRAVLPILKGHIIDRGPSSFTIQLQGFRVVVQCNMSALDIRDGDLLTLYTEVLLAPHNVSQGN